MPPFTFDDLHAVVARLDRALADARAADDPTHPEVSPELLAPPPRLGVAFYRALAGLSAIDGEQLDQAILRLDPGHPAARRSVVLRALGQRRTSDRRPFLDVVADAPMYGKPHLSVWGDQFAGDRPGEGMGLRHQGIAASLLPANPWACHNYSLQLAAEHRLEESYRWADRATIASPSFDRAHLDCVRRLREVGRPGQAFAEAQYRCKDVLQRASAGEVSPFEWPSRYHAGMLLAQVHADVGRLDEAIRIADDALADLDDPAAGPESFVWAVERVAGWRTQPGALARAYAREGFHRGDPGRVVAGFARTPVADADDAVALLEALVALGREDLARVGLHHLGGGGRIGDGKDRLLGARLRILGGDLDRAVEDVLVAELRRGQSRLEADVNRTLRLACVRRPDEWDGVVTRLVDRGALRLARLAARDLADFVPGLDPAVIERALGARPRREVDPARLAALADALPALSDGAAAIDARLAPPAEASLAAADQLGQEWWTVLVPPNKDRDAHAAGAVYACGVALAHYLALASGPPTPLSGAYRHVATEALHLVRRGRYEIDEGGARGLLELLDGSGAEDWLLDTWLLRVERALDLDNEHGGYLAALVDGLPRVAGLLRGDERLGWELRMAWDLAAEPGGQAPAAHLFERCQRAMETGAAAAAWSDVAAASLPPDQAIDVHWLAALANPSDHAEAWCNLARAQLALGRADDAFEALCRAAAAGAGRRDRAIAGFADTWAAAGLDVPFGFNDALRAGLAALDAGEPERAARCLRWCTARAPTDRIAGQHLVLAYARAGDVHRAVEAAAAFDRDAPARHAAAALVEAGQHAGAALALRYAALRSTAAEAGRAAAGPVADAGRVPADGSGPEATVERRAWDALAADDLLTVERLAAAGDSWGLFRAALAATERRSTADNAVPVPRRALDAARMVLDRSVGAAVPDAVLARIRALRVRENGFIQIDAPPPLGTRMTAEAFEAAFAERARAAARPGPAPDWAEQAGRAGVSLRSS